MAALRPLLGSYRLETDLPRSFLCIGLPVFFCSLLLSSLFCDPPRLALQSARASKTLHINRLPRATVQGWRITFHTLLTVSQMRASETARIRLTQCSDTRARSPLSIHTLQSARTSKTLHICPLCARGQCARGPPNSRGESRFIPRSELPHALTKMFPTTLRE